LPALVAELREGRPVLVLQNLRLATWPAWHYAVVVGYDPEREVFLVRSGRTERLATPAAELRRTWGLAGYWGLVVLTPGELPAFDDPAPYLEAVAAMEGIASASLLATAYRAALDRWPGHFATGFGLANALRESGDRDQAERMFRSLLAEQPGAPAVVNNLADLLIQRGRPKQALSLLDALLADEGGGGALRPVLEQTRGEALARAGTRGR
jgi:tetratricopeptide (TPR) repeat protein